jgi:hypothetical protein
MYIFAAPFDMKLCCSEYRLSVGMRVYVCPPLVPEWLDRFHLFSAFKGSSIRDHIKKYNIGVASNDTNFIPFYVKTGQQVQKLKWGNRQRNRSHKPSSLGGE